MLSALLLFSTAAFPTQPWREITVPSVAEAARAFRDPPPEYSLVMWWFWNGPMTEADIRHDLAAMRAQQVRSVMLWPYYGLSIEYLSPLWFERVRFAVAEARRLDMRVWFMDEGCYPSGFVGGKVSRERPHQRMRVIDRATLRPVYQTPPTRFIHTPGFAKDSTYSLFDALNPRATADFLADVHEQYRKHIGAEFGRTVLGFMGDEPSFPGVPYTGGIYEEFARRKGYDIQPHLARLFDPSTDEARRIRADYWDLWSDLYRDHFFKPQGDWCERNGMDFIAHICGEEDMKTLLKLNGDYFKCMRHVQMPGVDAIWRQIWPGTVADYPKLGSSAAHLWGRPRSFTEAYAVYGRGISLEQAKWVADHHLVRGINQIQAMSLLSAQHDQRAYFCPPDWIGSPQWPWFHQLAAYLNRLSYILSVGRPTANVALYYPTTSGWMEDFAADRAGLAIARDLLERQRDFDFIDEQGLAEAVTLERGALVNRSGQRYRAVVVPPLTVITRAALGRLEKFAAAGGKVLFAGKLPALVAGTSYLKAEPGPSALAWATVAESPRLLAALPPPDVTLRPAAPAVKCLRRSLRDGEAYFFFNESGEPVRTQAGLAGKGAAEIWDPVTGERQPASLQLHFDPFETKLIVLVPMAGKPAPRPGEFRQLRALDGAWQARLAGRSHSGPLQTWSAWGQASYYGTARYKLSFDLPAELASRRDLVLDLGEVRYSARAWLNGRELGARAWRPFRLPLGAAPAPGANLLEIEVANTLANELSGGPARRQIESRGWLRNSYIRIYEKFDQEMVPSGLLGPVRLGTSR